VDRPAPVWCAGTLAAAGGAAVVLAGSDTGARVPSSEPNAGKPCTSGRLHTAICVCIVRNLACSAMDGKCRQLWALVTATSAGQLGR
jgi:hypothetical protein